MALSSQELIHFLVSLAVITNAFGNLAIYISLTQDRSRREQVNTIKRMAIALVIIFLLVTWLGDWVLRFFGIELSAFQVAGGVILMLIGLSMLQSKQDQHAHAKGGENKPLVGIVPLAIPIIGGPGAMTVLFEAVHQYSSIGYKVAFSIIELAVIAFVSTIFYFSNQVERMLGDMGVNIVTRVMGLLLAAIASQMLLTGLKQGLFPH